MSGPAPKPREQRRRYNQPARGEWVDLELLGKPVLGVAEKDWPTRVRRLWVAWRADPVTSQYGPADLAAIYDLADQFEDLTQATQTKRMDGLGLTPKGKRDLRWRTPAEAATIEKRPRRSAPKLKLVAPDAVEGA